MTSSTTKIQAAGNGGTTTEPAPARREHGVAVLRSIESKSLITLAQDALSETHSVGHELHQAIYAHEPELSDEQMEETLCEALTCLETADHYLRMLSSVLDERKAHTGKPTALR
jgi:hypothetical protein